MDNNEGGSWSASPRTLGVIGAAALTAALVAATAADRPGQVLFALAAFGLSVLGTVGVWLRPRLVADEHQLTVRTIAGVVHLPWSEISEIVLRRTPRLGREVRVLEITPTRTSSSGGGLIVLTRGDLGADPQEVYTALMRLWARTD